MDNDLTANEFILRSPSMEGSELIPENYVSDGSGYHGKNISPPLEWKGAPPETKSFALTITDPDAAVKGGWRHWILANIPADIHSIAEGASSKGLLPKETIEIENDFEEFHYGGPCPPKKDKPHRYVFTLYALKSEKLNVEPESERIEFETALRNNILAKTSFTIKYGANSPRPN